MISISMHLPSYSARTARYLLTNISYSTTIPYRPTAVEHTGDNLTGEGEGDDESIHIDLTKIDPRATQIVFVVTIHKADERRQNFGQVHNSFIRVYNTATGEEILKYELEEDFSVETAVEFGRIYKRNGAWKFEAIGVGQKGGLAEYLNKYN